VLVLLGLAREEGSSVTATCLSTPILETPRLTLRGHRLDDFAALVAMWADPAVTRYISGQPSSEQQSWARLLTYAGHWALMGFGYWAIEERSTGAFVGDLGFADWNRELEPSIRGIPEAGWVLVPAAHGKGYATEALGAATAWADAHFGAARTVCIINPGNQPSIRVASKCGYREVTHAQYKGEPTILFSRG
jgi:RimJ/RimL family protein N-acetyltransferase